MPTGKPRTRVMVHGAFAPFPTTKKKKKSKKVKSNPGHMLYQGGCTELSLNGLSSLHLNFRMRPTWPGLLCLAGGRGGLVREESSEYLKCNACTRPGSRFFHLDSPRLNLRDDPNERIRNSGACASDLKHSSLCSNQG